MGVPGFIAKQVRVREKVRLVAHWASFTTSLLFLETQYILVETKAMGCNRYLIRVQWSTSKLQLNGFASSTSALLGPSTAATRSRHNMLLRCKFTDSIPHSLCLAVYF
jgi:hypothetical protein